MRDVGFVKKRIVRRKPSTEEGGTLLERLFALRGISNPSELDHGLAGMLPPSSLKNLEIAADLVAKHLHLNSKILIVGDFDADGATSCALMVSALTAMGAVGVEYLVPDRFRYGYGLTPEIVEVAFARSPDLIITVDNGIASIDGVNRANALGIQVLVTDHHLPGGTLPDAETILNPNQPGCEFASKALAGVGVAFYLLIGLRQNLRASGWFEQRLEPNLAEFLDLVALGTIADVVPMDQNNRRLVSEGLKRIRAGRCRPGLAALLAVSGIDPKQVASRDLAFFVGPRLNAAGRLEDMTIGIECLMADDHSAPALAMQLDDLNSQRKDIEADMREEAMHALKTLSLKDQQTAGLCFYRPDWHQGIVGIVASRIKDKSHRPVIAFARVGENELKGSGRSIQGFHMRDALDLIATRHQGLLTKFGGHAMAAGLTLRESDFESFSAAFDEVVRETLGEASIEQVVITDGELGQPPTLQLAKDIVDAAPWGQGFPEPEFDDKFEILSQRIVGSAHLKLLLQPTEGPPIDAICFNQGLTVDGRYVRCAYRLDINRYRGAEKPQLIVSLIQ
ncbi:MAG: single-stranded-DNA-specific exonuclease [Candidatus Azotimanducaceae bacterium]